jgi:hypothetical protein
LTLIEAKTLLNISILQTGSGGEIALYVGWLFILAIGIVVAINRRKHLRETPLNYEFKMDKETFNSYTNNLKSNLFNRGELVSSQDIGTYSTTLKKVGGLLVEKVMLNGRFNCFRVHESLQEYETYKPTTNHVDVDRSEDEYYHWLGKEATEEDLREIFGEPKPMTEEEKKRIEENSNLFIENDDDLPF